MKSLIIGLLLIVGMFFIFNKSYIDMTDRHDFTFTTLTYVESYEKAKDIIYKEGENNGWSNEDRSLNTTAYPPLLFWFDMQNEYVIFYNPNNTVNGEQLMFGEKRQGKIIRKCKYGD